MAVAVRLAVSPSAALLAGCSAASLPATTPAALAADESSTASPLAWSPGCSAVAGSPASSTMVCSAASLPGHACVPAPVGPSPARLQPGGSVASSLADRTSVSTSAEPYPVPLPAGHSSAPPTPAVISAYSPAAHRADQG